MIESDAIRTEVANTAVDQLYANVDVEAAIADRLPAAQKGLAPVLAGLLRSGADRAAVTALERPRVQSAWVATTTATQRQLVRLLDDKTKFQTKKAERSSSTSARSSSRSATKWPLSVGWPRNCRTPPGRSPSSTRANWRQPRRSRGFCAQSPTGCGLSHSPSRHSQSGLAAGVAGSSSAHSRSACSPSGSCCWSCAAAAGGYLVDQLAKDDSVKPAVRDAWSILTQTLSDRAWVWITLGLVLLVGVWFVGDTRRAIQARRTAQPTLENRWAAYGIAAGSCSCLGSSLLSSPAAGRPRLPCSPSLSPVSRWSEASSNEKHSRDLERLTGAGAAAALE